jgi:single-stranded-DNA-specific exonuclease
MAAGLSVDAENIPALRRGLSRAVEKTIQATGAPPVRALQLDGYLSLSDLSLELVADLERLAPFGPGNPPLALAIRDLVVTSSTEIGRDNAHLQLIVEDRAGEAQKVLWWGGAGWPQPQDRFDLACALRTSNFRGQQDLQVEWIDFRPIEDEAIALRTAQRKVVDLRSEAHPRPALEALRTQEGLVLWCEGDALGRLDGKDRAALQPAPTLVIWTTPPGPQELQAALEKVHPVKVVLFAVDPEDSGAQGFLQRLIERINQSLKNREPATLAQLAGATAQRESAVRLGLNLLQALGKLSVRFTDGQPEFSPASGSDATKAEALQDQLIAVLSETAAYRRYFKSTPPENLFL